MTENASDTTKAPCISIVVPIYNEERYVEGCAAALLAQDYPRERFEVLMVDNNSSDRSAEIVDGIDGIELLFESEQGDYAARNRGIARSRGEIIAFTDADTAPHPDWLRNIATRMEDATVSVIVGRLQFAGSSRALSMLEVYEEDKAAFVFQSADPEIYFGYTCNLAARRTLFDTLGPFAPVERNADVVFVRKVVDAMTPSSVVYSRDVAVTRLEIASLGDYFSKQALYGRDYPRYAARAAARRLSTRERLSIFRHIVRQRDYTLAEGALLLGTLAIGAICYDVSRWYATIRGG